MTKITESRNKIDRILAEAASPAEDALAQKLIGEHGFDGGTAYKVAVLTGRTKGAKERKRYLNLICKANSTNPEMLWKRVEDAFKQPAGTLADVYLA